MYVMDGGNTISSALDAGLIGVLTLHLAPVVLGGGTPLFTGGVPHELTRRSVTRTTTATHIA